MIRWLWSKLMKWGWDFSYSASQETGIKPLSRIRANNSISICDDDSYEIGLPDPINFKVQTVSGGTLVETRWYDHKKDESRVKLHIVTSEENLSESIGKIVTMELLQK